jgi:hypothetical protein
MVNNIQAKEEEKVSLDEEDPEIVGLGLRFMYKQNYSVQEKPKQPYTIQGINVREKCQIIYAELSAAGYSIASIPATTVR